MAHIEFLGKGFDSRTFYMTRQKLPLELPLVRACVGDEGALVQPGSRHGRRNRAESTL